MQRKIKIGFVEDHEMVRQGIVLLLKEESALSLLFDVSNGAEVLEILKKKRPDILLLDIEMPLIDGKIVLKTISEKYPEIKVIMISAHSDRTEIVECIALGARGFLPKHADFDKIVDAVFSVYETGYYFDEFVSKALVSEILSNRNQSIPSVSIALTIQEIEIIKMVCSGMKNWEIGERLFLSKRTIEGYRNRISIKTNTTNVVELLHYAIKHGIYQIN